MHARQVAIFGAVALAHVLPASAQEAPGRPWYAAGEVARSKPELTAAELTETCRAKQNSASDAEPVMANFPVYAVYPSRAVRLELPGAVQITLIVKVDGSVKDIEAKSLTDTDMFNASTAKAYASSQWCPKLVNGQPVEARVTAEPYTFRTKRG